MTNLNLIVAILSFIGGALSTFVFILVMAHRDASY